MKSKSLKSLMVLVSSASMVYKAMTGLEPTDVFIPVELKPSTKAHIISGMVVHYYYLGAKAQVFVLNMETPKDSLNIEVKIK